MKKYSVAVDFDGVLHSYSSPWIDAQTIPDPPVAGAIAWLNRIAEDFEVVIFTTRAATVEGREAVSCYLAAHGVDSIQRFAITAEKLPALVYIDDRAYRFDGQNFPTAQQIHAARPWNKPPAETAVSDAGQRGGDPPRVNRALIDKMLSADLMPMQPENRADIIAEAARYMDGEPIEGRTDLRWWAAAILTYEAMFRWFERGLVDVATEAGAPIPAPDAAKLLLGVDDPTGTAPLIAQIDEVLMADAARGAPHAGGSAE